MCRPGCAACCIYISISSPLPGMPEGKPAGVRCANLDEENRCRIHGQPNYPQVCSNFKPDRETCGDSNEHARDYLTRLEALTS
ncbi:MAG: YkgJ family cysteine cluster protein [Spirochaetales bacterium]|nr:YkgJ family cysteine cluster protein [Spirochaetales bacterium]